jgi:hypothetical protein
MGRAKEIIKPKTQNRIHNQINTNKRKHRKTYKSTNEHHKLKNQNRYLVIPTTCTGGAVIMGADIITGALIITGAAMMFGPMPIAGCCT